MFTKLNDFTAENSLNFEAGLTLANIVFASTERLAALNLSTARTLFDQSTATVKSWFDGKDARSFFDLQAAQAAPLMFVEHAIAYSRGVFELAVETKDEVAKVIEVQVADAEAKVSGLVDKALRSAPAGSEPAVATIRQAIDAANSAYATFNNVAKQVGEMTETNLTAAGNAVLNAGTTAAAKAKKAA
jgi:phasin family protein